MKTLKEYQKKGAAFLYAKKKAMLIMGCRTGKTLTALTACKLISMENSEILNVKVLAPVTTNKVWLREWMSVEATNSNHLLELHYLSPHKKRDHVIGKEDVLIIDECQLYMHNWDKQRSIIEMAKRAKYCFMLTATPLTNDPINLYWPLRICGETISKRDYKLKYMGGKVLKSDPKIVYPTGVTNIEELKVIKEKHSFSYFRHENIVISDEHFGPAPIKTAGSLENYSNIQKILGLAKLENYDIKEWLKHNMFKKNNKALIFFRHKEVGNYLEKYFKDYYRAQQHAILKLDGSVSVNDRLKLLEKFKRINLPKILILSIEVGGVGFDLQGVSSDVFFFERTWSPTKDYQAYMRVYGFKPKEQINVYYLNYTDEAKLIVNERKKILQEV